MTQLVDSSQPEVYQGHFGEFTITESDRTGVTIYRGSLIVAAIIFAIATFLVLWQGDNPTIQQVLTPLYVFFSLALGISLSTIHIYMILLHRFLQVLWAIGGIAALTVTLQNSEPLALVIYNHPHVLWGIGFTFAALTGIYFKEAFCFNRLETKFLTPIVPFLFLGHIWGFLSPNKEQFLLALWAILFLVFALRKLFQPIPQDIGDKSVFDRLHSQQSA